MLCSDNPEGYFPTYQPSEERLAAIKEQFSEENNPLNVHYDASREVRAKGAAFYQLSGDEETRKRQIEELKKARDETEKMRQDVGALDVQPGEVEGMVAPTQVAEGSLKSRALEKRKRDIEARRKLLDAKRRKKDPGSSSNVPTPQPGPSSSPSPGPHLLEEAAPRQSSSKAGPATSFDPFAALEAQSTSSKKGKGKAVQPVNTADEFLASLEAEIMKGGKR